MIEPFMHDYKEKIDARLSMLFSERGQAYDSVLTAGSYSLTGGGKRIRPIILLEFYKIFGGADDCAYNFACALEMIHTYSLIHDDLPCMDNDDFRRGRPSCHKQYGEATALLAGDALLTEAFGVAARTLGLPAERITKGIEVLSASAGAAGMIGGQVLDIEGEGKDNELSRVLDMYKLKTGALIKAAAVCGAILAGAEDEDVKIAEKYAESLGVAFQVIDDILDVTGDSQLLGKPIGSDDKNGKNTAVSILGTEKARALAAKLTDEALSALEMLPGNKDNLRSLTEYLLVREY